MEHGTKSAKNVLCEERDSKIMNKILSIFLIKMLILLFMIGTNL